MYHRINRAEPVDLIIYLLYSIDFKTDAKIQTAVREEFKNSCLLTIAHRIRTVIDYDRLVRFYCIGFKSSSVSDASIPLFL